jgi:hypothetical protein
MWILAKKLRNLFRRGNKIHMEEVTKAKFGAETEGMTIQRLPQLRDICVLSSFWLL